MLSKLVKQDRMGWLPVGVLALSLALISSSAFALNIDQEMARQNADSAQLINTLGRHKTPNQETSKATNKAVKVEMLPASAPTGKEAAAGKRQG